MESRVVDRAMILLFLTVLFEILKASVLKSERWREKIPLMSGVLGVVLMVGWAYVQGALMPEAIMYSVLDGVIVGASASGLYEGAKAGARTARRLVNNG